VQFKVYLIGHPLGASWPTESHGAAFDDIGLPIAFERCDVPPVNFHRVMTALLREQTFLGAKIAAPYKQTTLAYCQEVSPVAQGIGAVNTLVRRPSGLVHGHNTDVAAFVRCIQSEGVKRVRTALILGAGGAARVALAGLRELGCARYLVGYRQPRRPAELSSQFKGIRRQIGYFPLQELTEFSNWAQEAGLFDDARPIPLPPGDAQDDGIKRWNLLVNATPVGLPPDNGESIVTCPRFLRCFERAIDLVPSPEPTRLIELCIEAGVPVLPGKRVFDLQAEFSRELWIKEYERRAGLGAAPTAAVKRQPVIKPRPR